MKILMKKDQKIITKLITATQIIINHHFQKKNREDVEAFFIATDNLAFLMAKLSTDEDFQEALEVMRKDVWKEEAERTND